MDNLWDFDVEYSVDRAVLETLLHDYLQGLPRLIGGCLQEADMSGEEIDLVILTGGHSQWYFVKDILTGKNKAFGDCGLKKAEADNDRVISIALPQETVALGLAFSGLVSEPKPIPVPDPDPDPDPVPGPLGGVVVAGGAKWIGKKEDEKDGEKGLPFLMPIEIVIDKPDKGVVVIGVIERGTVRVGDRIQIVGMSPTWSDLDGCGVVNEIEMFHKGIDCATAGDSVGLLLSQEIVAKEVERGMVVCAPDSVSVIRRFIGAVNSNNSLLSSDYHDNGKLQFRFRTMKVGGRIMGYALDLKHYLFSLDHRVAMEEGLSFDVLKDGKTICSGTVTDMLSQNKKANKAALSKYNSDSGIYVNVAGDAKWIGKKDHSNEIEACIKQLNQELNSRKFINVRNRDELRDHSLDVECLQTIFSEIFTSEILFFGRDWVMTYEKMYFSRTKKHLFRKDDCWRKVVPLIDLNFEDGFAPSIVVRNKKTGEIVIVLLPGVEDFSERSKRSELKTIAQDLNNLVTLLT